MDEGPALKCPSRRHAARGTCDVMARYWEPAANWCPLESRGIHQRSFYSKFSILQQRRRCSWDNEIPIGFHHGISALLDREDGTRGGWCVTAGHRLDSKSQYKVCITEHSELLQLWTNSITVLLQAECTVLVFRGRQARKVRGKNSWGGGEGGRRPREEDGEVSLMLNYSFCQ